MNKQEILDSFPIEEDKITASKILDKIETCKLKNKITNTNFLGIHEISIAKKILEFAPSNAFFYGGFDECERKMLIIYPEKLPSDVLENILMSFLKIVRIQLPSDLYGRYSHKNYLGTIMKLGIKREKVGDILVTNSGADIIVLSDIAEFILNELKELRNFNNSEISLVGINELINAPVQKQELNIIIPSMRIDCTVGELVKTSRTKANELILSGRVFINGINILKNSKTISEGNLITIRGKGRFEISQIQSTTKKGRIVLKVYKYI